MAVPGLPPALQPAGEGDAGDRARLLQVQDTKHQQGTGTSTYSPVPTYTIIGG